VHPSNAIARSNSAEINCRSVYTGDLRNLHLSSRERTIGFLLIQASICPKGVSFDNGTTSEISLYQSIGVGSSRPRYSHAVAATSIFWPGGFNYTALLYTATTHTGAGGWRIFLTGIIPIHGRYLPRLGGTPDQGRS
jgi:hypothetical protein